jgi:hypothetical protein
MYYLSQSDLNSICVWSVASLALAEIDSIRFDLRFNIQFNICLCDIPLCDQTPFRITPDFSPISCSIVVCG